MLVRIEVKDAGGFGRPSLYKPFLLLLVLIELYQKSSVADLVVRRKVVERQLWWLYFRAV